METKSSKLRVNELGELFVYVIKEFGYKNPDLSTQEIESVLLKMLKIANDVEIKGEIT
jgi:ribonucleotide reductase beta subunit family protein with ferritin-like domain